MAVTEVAKALKDKTAICGASVMLGSFPEDSLLSLVRKTFDGALDDAGLKRSDIDGVICPSFGADYDRILEMLGVDVRFAFQGWSHGRFISPLLQIAAMAVGTGLARTIAIVHAKKKKPYGQLADHEMWRQGLGPHGESPAIGAFSPGLAPALAVQRYFHMYGGSNIDLAPIAVAFRKHARLNPQALRRGPMTIEDHQNSRWVIEPLRLFDCCQNNDGSACILITSAEHARDCKKPPVYISGMQGVHAGPQFHNFALPGLGVAGQKTFKYVPQPEDLYAYQMAGVTCDDVDALMTYDAFTPTVLFVLERFGFCGPGEAREFVKNGRIELGGQLPINTSGGLLSEGHESGWNMFTEAVRQLRGECGERQVKDAEIIQYGSFLGESVILRR